MSKTKEWYMNERPYALGEGCGLARPKLIVCLCETGETVTYKDAIDAFVSLAAEYNVPLEKVLYNTETKTYSIDGKEIAYLK